jgi:hypothetical protein
MRLEQASCDRPSQRKKVSDRRSHQPWCDDTVRARSGERGAGHSVNDGACSVLDYCTSTGGANRAKSFSTVVTHACKHHSDNIPTECLCGTLEQGIRRRANAAHERPLIDLYHGKTAAKHNGHVPITGSEINPARDNGFVLPCDRNWQRT